MSLESPVSVLFNSDGYEVSVLDGAALPAQSAGLLIAGSDGSNTRYISLDASGRQLVVGAGSAGTPDGGVLSIQGVSGGQAVDVIGQVDIGSVLSAVEVVQATASNLLASVGGLGAAGSAPVGNPVRMGGSDGSLTTDILTDSAGRLVAVGAAASGSALAGAPVRIGASDGTNALDVLADSAGRLISVGAADAGSAVAGAPVRMGGSDGSLTTDILTDTDGRLMNVGAAAAGSAVAGNPLRIGGSDGSLTTDILTDAAGHLLIAGPDAAGAAPSANPILMAGWDGTNVQIFKTDSTGALAINEVKASASSIASFAASTSAATFLAANAAREGAVIYNDSNRPLYIKLGASASTSSFSVRVGAMGYYEIPASYTGDVSALWDDAAADGAALVTELTA